MATGPTRGPLISGRRFPLARGKRKAPRAWRTPRRRASQRWPTRSPLGGGFFGNGHGANLWLHSGDDHPFATNFDAHQDNRVLTHSHMGEGTPLLVVLRGNQRETNQTECRDLKASSNRLRFPSGVPIKQKWLVDMSLLSFGPGSYMSFFGITHRGVDRGHMRTSFRWHFIWAEPETRIRPMRRWFYLVLKRS